MKHRDEVEEPLTDWLREAYAFEDTKLAKPATVARKTTRKATKKAKSKR